MKRLVYLLPITGFALLAIFLFKSLWSPSPELVPSVVINKPAPRLVLPALDARTSAFARAAPGSRELRQDKRPKRERRATLSQTLPAASD